MTAATLPRPPCAAAENSRPAVPARRISAWRPAATLAAVMLVAGVLRLVGPGWWPVFVDEDLYSSAALEMTRLSWADAVLHPAVTIGKPPWLLLLQGWLASPVGDVLLAGRVIAAASGTLTTALCFVLGRRIGGPSVGFATAALYGLSPLAVLHERMALQDGPVTACALAAVLLGWLAVERGSWRLSVAAMLLGAVAVQLKVPAVAIAAVPIAFLGRSRRRTGLALLVAAGPVVSYQALMASALGPGLTHQNQDRLAFSLAALQANLQDLGDTLTTYFPLGLAILVPVGALLLLRADRRAGAIVLAGLLVSSVPWLLISNFSPSRYYLLALPYAAALMALALVRLPALVSRFGRASVLVTATGLAAVVAAGAVSLWLIADHRTAPLTRLDDWQYRSAWPSGYGYAEAARLVAETAGRGSEVWYAVDPRHQIAVGAHRPLPPGIRSLGVHDPGRPPRIDARRSLYVIVDDKQDTPVGSREATLRSRQPRLEVLARFSRPGSDAGVSVLWRP